MVTFTLQMASNSWWSSSDYIQYSPLFPNPWKCAKDMVITGAEELYSRFPWKGVGVWLMEAKDNIIASANIDAGIFLYPLFFAVFFTVLRVFLNWAIFKVNYGKKIICGMI